MTHPQHRQHRLQIERNEFVGACDGPTPACTVFDFLAMCLGSYEEAIEYAIAHYYNLASLPSGMTFDSVRDQMVLGLQEEREQFENILSLRDPLRKRTEKLIGGYIYCRGKGLDPNHIWRMLYIVRGEDLNLVLQRWLKPGKTFERGKCYLVFPYLRSRHAFAALEICDLNEKHLMTLQLIPCAHMFLGLHTCFPDTRQTQVFSTRQEAAANYSQAMERGDYHLGFVHTRFNPNGENSEPSLRSGVFVVTKTTDFNTLVKNGQAFEELKIIDRQGKFAEAIEPVPWRQYGVNSMLKGLREDPKVAYASTLESLRGDAKVLPALLEHLQSHDQKAVVNRIRRQLSGHELFVQGGMHTIEGPTGYVATKPGTNLSSQFTNFLIQIDSSIRFEESEQTYFSGWIVLNGRTVPFFISNAQTHQPRAILLQAQLAANRVAIPNLPMPTIIDPTHQRKLTTIIAQQIGNRPKIIGVQRLGWTPTKDRFVTPTWEARALGLATTSKVLHPGSETIARAFSFLDYKVTDDTGQCTPQA